MHMLIVLLMRILDALIRMHVLDVLLLLLATTVIAPLFGISATEQKGCWQRCCT